MDINQQKTLKILSSLCLAGLLLLSISLSLGLAQGSFLKIRATISSDGANRDAFNPNNLSADGTKVAFESDSDYLGQGIVDDQYEIWLYDTASMTLTRVTTASDGTTRDSFDPSLSADGTKVVFQSDADLLGGGIVDDQREIWLYDTATMTVTQLTTTSDRLTRDSFSPSISADGTKVAFISDADFLGQGIANGQFEVWLYDTTSMTVTRVTTSSDGNNRTSSSPSLNMDGTNVTFTSDSDFLGQGIAAGQREAWLYDTVAMTVTRVTTSSDGVNRDVFNPSLSTDGTKVAFQSDSDYLGQGIADDQQEIWLYDTATMTLTRVTTSSDGANRVSRNAYLSGDGTKIAFDSDSDLLGQGIADNQNEIWLYDIATMVITQVTTSSDVVSRNSVDPALNMDGTIVAFQSDSDFLSQGIVDEQNEIWLFTYSSNAIYLPIIFKN